MKSDHDRKKDSLRKLGEKIISPVYEMTISWETDRRTVGLEIDHVGLGCNWISLTQLQEFQRALLSEEVEVRSSDNSTWIWITGVGRWPWEM